VIQPAQPSISIFIPTYNDQTDLSACLESLRCLDYPKQKIEVVIWDNHSLDDTISMVEERFREMKGEGWLSLKLIKGEKNEGPYVPYSLAFLHSPSPQTEHVDADTLASDLEGLSEEEQEKLKKFERFGRREREATERFGRTLGRFFKNIGSIVENRLMRDREPTDLLSMSEVDQVVPNREELERTLFDASQRDINNAFGLGWQEGVEDIEEELERETAPQ